MQCRVERNSETRSKRCRITVRFAVETCVDVQQGEEVERTKNFFPEALGETKQNWIVVYMNCYDMFR